MGETEGLFEIYNLGGLSPSYNLKRDRKNFVSFEVLVTCFNFSLSHPTLILMNSIYQLWLPLWNLIISWLEH